MEEKEKRKIIKTINTLSNAANTIIAQAQADLARSGVHDFVLQHLSKCFRLVSNYKDAFNVLSVKDRNELEALISSIFIFAGVREAFDELLQSEREWDDFMIALDRRLSTQGGASLEVGDRGPMDYNVVSSEFDAAGVNILIVSFGQHAGAVKWIKDTNVPFDMVLDEDRKIYHSFGLHRWVSKVWNVATMTYYAEQLTAGRTLPKPYEHISDDPIQMGGDFILNSKGTVVFTYASHMSSDRPSIDALLSAVQDGAQSREGSK